MGWGSNQLQDTEVPAQQWDKQVESEKFCKSQARNFCSVFFKATHFLSALNTGAITSLCSKWESGVSHVGCSETSNWWSVKHKNTVKLGMQIHEHNCTITYGTLCKGILDQAQYSTGHPSTYSPDSVPRDFLLFPQLRSTQNGKRLHKVKDIIQSLTWELNNPLKDECTLTAIELLKSLRSINNVQESGDIESSILNFRTRWRWMVIFTSWSLNHHTHSRRSWMYYRTSLDALEKRKIAIPGGNSILILQLSTLQPNHDTDSTNKQTKRKQRKFNIKK